MTSRERLRKQFLVIHFPAIRYLLTFTILFYSDHHGGKSTESWYVDTVPLNILTSSWQHFSETSRRTPASPVINRRVYLPTTPKKLQRNNSNWPRSDYRTLAPRCQGHCSMHRDPRSRSRCGWRRAMVEPLALAFERASFKRPAAAGVEERKGTNSQNSYPHSSATRHTYCNSR